MRLAAFLPHFLEPGGEAGSFLKVSPRALDGVALHYRLAWNPRLLRLNPRATRHRDFLLRSLAAQMLQIPQC